MTPNLINNETVQFGLKSSILIDLRKVFDSFPEIDEVIIFGSRAKGNFRNGSGVDLVLKGEIDLNTLTKIEFKIDDLMLPYTFDIAIFNRLNNNELLEHINRVGIVIYSREK